MRLNPAVIAAAELFTDGQVTDQLLADIAAQRQLPLFIEAVLVQPLSPEEYRAALVRNAEARVREARRCYVTARGDLRHANALKAGSRGRRHAFAWFNSRRRAMLRAERDLWILMEGC